MAPRISVVVNTLNEERNLPFALRSVTEWASEIVVVDMHSDDRTQEVARELGATVYPHARTEAVDAARGYAIGQATGDWVLLLDADELIPRPLSERLLEIAREDSADVVVLPMENYLLGARVRHSGWGAHQDSHPRFFKPDHMSADDTIHDFLTPLPGARVLRLQPEPGRSMVHFNYLDTQHFLAKLNRYTTVEALQAFRRGERFAPRRMLVRAAREFAGRYVRRQGFRDGWRGLCLALLMACYRIAAYAKLAELEHAGSREAIRARYAEEAERILAGYGRQRVDSHAGGPASRRTV